MDDKEQELDLIWGIENIGKLIGRSVPQTYHMLTNGRLPARRVGERWVASRPKLIAFFLEDAARASPPKTQKARPRQPSRRARSNQFLEGKEK